MEGRRKGMSAFLDCGLLRRTGVGRLSYLQERHDDDGISGDKCLAS